MIKIWPLVMISLFLIGSMEVIVTVEGEESDVSSSLTEFTRNSSTTGLMNSTFPMFKGDPQRTGRCNVDTSDNPGIIKWTFPTDSPSESTPVIDINGTIYFGTHTGYFYAVYPNGSEKWNFYTGQHIYASGVLDSYGHIYFPCVDGYFYCLYTSNGTLRWRIPRGVGEGGPVIYNDTIYHYGVGGFCAIDLEGNLLWINSSYNFYRSCPAVGHDGILYIGSYDNYLQAVYPNNGTLKWEFETGYYVSTTPAIDKNGTIYFGCWDGYFYALNPNGTLKWKKYRPGPVNNNWYSSPIINFNNEIIVIDPLGYVCKYNSNGSLLSEWSSGGTKSTPTIDNNNILYRTMGSTLYASKSDRTLHMVIGIAGSFRSSAVFGPDNTVYLISSNSGLIAIGKKEPNKPLLYLNQTGDGLIWLNWTIINDTLPQCYDIGPSSIQIMKRKASEEDFSLLATVGGTDRYYNDTDVSNGIEYDYYLIALNEYGESEPSNIVSGIPMTVPGPPTNLISHSGEGFVELSWGPPIDDGGTDITGYEIWKKDSASTEFSIIAELNPEINAYNDTDVINGEEYDYYLTATNIRGRSEPSQAISSIPATVPGRPFLGSNEGNGFIILNWDPPSFTGGRDIVGWRLFKGTEAGDKQLLVEMNADLRTYNVTDVENGITYHFHLTCFNEMGESQPSNPVSEIPRGPPTEPMSLEAESGNNFVHLTWTQPISDEGSKLLGYIITSEWSIQGTSMYQTFSVEGENSTEYNDTSVTNGVEYRYTVISVNMIGESEPSNEVTVTPMTVPGPPIDLQVKEGNGFVEIYWKGPEDNGGSPITGYRIYREEGLFDFELLVELDETTKSYNDTSVENGITYSYYVVSINENGPSVPSDIVNGVPTRALTVPSAPDNLTFVVGEDFVHLYWGPPEDDGGSSITEYRIYRGVTSDSVSIFRTVGPETTDLNDTSVEPGTTYYYYLTCTNEKGESDNSSLIIVTTLDEGSNPSNGHTGIILAIIIGVIVLILAVLGGFFFIVKRKRGPDEEQIISPADQQPLIDDGIFQMGEEQINQTVPPSYEEEPPLVKDYQNDE